MFSMRLRRLHLCLSYLAGIEREFLPGMLGVIPFSPAVPSARSSARKDCSSLRLLTKPEPDCINQINGS